MPDQLQNPEDAPQPAAARPVPTAKNKTSRPPGIVPKNAQTWVIAGVSLVMVAAIALSGNGSKTKPTATSPQQSGVIDPSAARIAEYRNRLEEETRRLSAEQATLNQAKQAAASSDPRLAAVMQPGSPVAAYNPAPLQPSTDDRQAARKQLEAERERKEYSSLFSSNIALTLRKDARDTEAASEPPQTAATYPYIPASPPEAPAGVGISARPRIPQTEARADEAQARTNTKSDPELTRADGKNYRLLEGTLLETVLTNRIAGSFAGPVNTMLTTDVYSHDREHLLIPQGSRILGEVKPVSNFGQERLAVVFHRIVMPDGYSVSLDQFQGLSQIGETGLRDQVNHHYLEIFGVSIAIGAVAGLSQATTQYGFTESATDEYRQGFAASTSQSALRILDRFLNILPTFTIREGHRIKIYLASDLSLPAYDRHKVPSEF